MILYNEKNKLGKKETMKRLKGQGKKQKISNESVATTSSNEVKVLRFPENSCSSEKKKRNIHFQTKNERIFASSKSANDEKAEKKDKRNDDLEIDSSLKRLEETEKKLKYHIRELESYLGLS